MPLLNGIHFDHDGNMSRVTAEPGQIEAMCFENIGCKRLVRIRLRPGLDLWLDEEGADNGQSENTELTRFAARFGIDYPIYGDGVILGRDFEGDPSGLYEEELSRLVVGHAVTMLQAFATTH